MTNSDNRPNGPISSRFEVSRNVIQIAQRESTDEVAIAINGVPIPVELVRREPVPIWRSPLTYGDFTDPKLLAEYVVRTQSALEQPRLSGLRRPDADISPQQPNDG